MADIAIEVNCETGEVVERPLTSDEIAAREEAAKQAEADRAAQEAADKAAADAKAAAQAKLLALGLTQDEIDAISK